MFKNKVFPIIIVFVLILISCGSKSKEDSAQNNAIENTTKDNNSIKNEGAIIVGANLTERYLPILKGKRVGIVANDVLVQE